MEKTRNKVEIIIIIIIIIINNLQVLQPGRLGEADDLVSNV